MFGQFMNCPYVNEMQEVKRLFNFVPSFFLLFKALTLSEFPIYHPKHKSYGIIVFYNFLKGGIFYGKG
jgi:hypothetical protein